MARRRGGLGWAGATAVALLQVLPCATPALALDTSEQLDRLLFESKLLEEKIERSGRLHGDAALDAYLQSVTDRLFPEYRGKLRVHALRDPQMNAFALPSGSLYIYTGALLRIRNEAELAALLGHEGVHVVEEHSLEAVESSKELQGASLVLSAGLTALLGFDPMLQHVATLSTMAGFSRSREREADEQGQARMMAAGYSDEATGAFFHRADREAELAKARKIVYPFASHPRWADRADDAMTRTATGTGEMRREEYLAATAAARRAAIEELRLRRRGTEIVFLLGEEGMAEDFVPDGHYLLGEGYRLRNDEGDAERALEQYRQSIAAAPEFAPAWGALGRAYHRAGDLDQARLHLERFLQLAPDAREAPFARQALQALPARTATGTTTLDESH